MRCGAGGAKCPAFGEFILAEEKNNGLIARVTAVTHKVFSWISLYSIAKNGGHVLKTLKLMGFYFYSGKKIL